MRSSERACTRAAMLVTVALLTSPVQADDLGTVGPTYAIAEPDLLALIRGRLKEAKADGTLAQLEADARSRARRRLGQPEPVAGLTRATRPRTYHFDPGIVVPYPVTDASGQVLVPPGTRVNPLDTVHLTRALLFLDARDDTQLARARKVLEEHHGQVKLILTGGSPLDLARRWRLPVHFDQGGRISSHLGLAHVPALVTQEGRRLRIDEIP